jgi:hypothetical protein
MGSISRGADGSSETASTNPQPRAVAAVIGRPLRPSNAMR